MLDPSKLGEESGASINRIESVRQRVMSFLEDEFRCHSMSASMLNLIQPTMRRKMQTESGDTADNEADSQGFPPNVVLIMKE
ncbi:hypothetical protein MLD38_024438 [Melastoma candidum]|uniref:Uncharacterized protein n=1 Tax=Melastoma candidum TaxID=119954 RepID=A0ACB9NTL3_9MYRT|nr:hypothetical protein MLD38_024438 [Melastoma candidum]